MIRNESEYREAVERLTAANLRIEQQESQFAENGLSPEEVKRLLDPMRSFYGQLQDEIDSYEKLK